MRYMYSYLHLYVVVVAVVDGGLWLAAVVSMKWVSLDEEHVVY